MTTTNRFVPFALAFWLTGMVLGACGGGGEVREETAAAGGSERAGSAAAAAPAGPSGLPEPCLTDAEVSSAVGFPVRVLREGTQAAGETVVCAYQGTDPQPGAFVSIVVGPASGSGEAMEEVKSAAKSFLGAQAEAERIDVGEGGYAYGSASKSEAAAVAGGRLYRVDVTSTASADLGDKKAAVVQILREVMD